MRPFYNLECFQVFYAFKSTTPTCTTASSSTTTSSRRVKLLGRLQRLFKHRQRKKQEK